MTDFPRRAFFLSPERCFTREKEIKYELFEATTPRTDKNYKRFFCEIFSWVQLENIDNKKYYPICKKFLIFKKSTILMSLQILRNTKPSKTKITKKNRSSFFNF